jgi:hypothetical protein
MLKSRDFAINFGMGGIGGGGRSGIPLSVGNVRG